MRKFTLEELRAFDGRSGPAYIAFGGRVYDVSGSFLWRDGRHQAGHSAGSDLTEDIKKAPHGAELIQRFPVVGVLIDRGSGDG